MKKTFVTVLFIMLLTIPFVVSATDGELSFKTDGGFAVLSGGVGDCDGFGFAVSDGERIIHLYVVGCKPSEPFSVKLTGMTDNETEIRLFTETGGVFAYGIPYYVTNKIQIQSLDEIKTVLINECKSLVNKELYRDAEKKKIEELTSDTQMLIQQSDRRYPADEAFLFAKTEILKLKTDEQFKTEELLAKKNSAIKEISEFVDKTLYRPAEQAIIEAVVSEAIEQINTATELSLIDSVVLNAKTNLSSLKTNAEYEAEELAEFKQTLVDELNSLVDPTDYRAYEQGEIERIISQATLLIQSGISKSQSESCFESAKTEILKLKTDEQFKTEELLAKKNSAIKEISEFVDKTLYRPAEQAIIEAVVSEAIEQINTATELSLIDSVVLNAKTNLSSLKTNAEYEAEELTEFKQTLVDELNSLVDPADYRAYEQGEIERIISQATLLIQSGISKSQSESYFESAKTEIMKLKTDSEHREEELAAAKLSAISEINGYLDKSLYLEAEQITIDAVITEYTGYINSATTVEEVNKAISDAKYRLDRILTVVELEANKAENAEVLVYLKKAVSELEDTRFVGKEKKLINIVLPVMEVVISDGTYGRIVITPEYVKSEYNTEVANAREIYESMSDEIEKPAFEQKLAQLDMETQAFLKEYFL